MAKPITLRELEGVNNLSREHALAPNVLREAVNLDLDRDKKARTRAGYSAPIVPCTLGHSFWTDPALPFALYADGADLYAFGEDESATRIAGGLSAGRPLSYTQINSGAYWSNGAQSGYVSLDLDALAWCCEAPDGQPALAAQPQGGLPAGTLKVAVTFVDRLGRESGSTTAAEITTSAEGGLLVTQIPQPRDPDVQQVRLYLAATDAVLYRYATLPVGTTQLLILAPAEGPKLTTQFLQPMPPGQLVAEFSGRLLVARGRHLLWSPTLRYGLVRPRQDFLALRETIDLLAPLGHGSDAAGVFVAAGARTYYLGGRQPAEWSAAPAYGYGAVPGSMVVMPAQLWGIESARDVPVWTARNGHVVIGAPGGQVVPINTDTAVGPVPERGAALFREAEGLYQYLLASRGAVQPRMAIGDTAIARTYHHDGSVS